MWLLLLLLLLLPPSLALTRRLPVAPVACQCCQKKPREMTTSTTAKSITQVSTLGPLGTYTNQAAKQHFGDTVTYKLEDTIRDVFVSVDDAPKTSALAGVCPIENSTNGAVLETQDCLREFSVREISREKLKIGHALLRRRGTAPDILVERIYSHEQGLGQCRRYIASHYPDAEAIPINSTAAAALKAASDPASLAISSILCAEVYGLDIIDTEIQDGQANETTFIVFEKAD